MLKLRAFAAPLTVVAGLLITGAPPAIAEAEFKLTYAEIASDRGPRAAAMKWWADELNKRSGGRLEIEFFWAGSLANSKNTLKAVNSGLAEMGTLVASTHPAETQMWQLGGVPFNEPDPWVGMRGMFEARQTNEQFAAEAADKGYKLLFQNTTGPIEMLCRDGFYDTVEKLKGAKIRSTGGHLTMFSNMGANSLTTAGGDVYSGLDRGLFDCTVWYTPLVKSYKLYEVAGYLTYAGMGQPLVYGGIINLETFNSLPEDLQNILVETSIEYMDVYAQNIVEGNEAAAAAMEAGIDGYTLQINALTPEERERWKSHAVDLVDEWKTKSGLSEEDADQFIADVDAAMAKYNTILAEQGYPWRR